MLTTLLVSIGSCLLPPQTTPPSTLPQEPPAAILTTTPFHGVFVDHHRHADGGFWARGDHYKMRFGADGAQYLPLFSSRAPRHWPLHFQSAFAVEPVLHENGCTFDRGDIVERWDLRPAGAEQTFVLRRRPADDVLILQIATDLVFGGSGPAGLRFLAEGWGEVAYGQAFAMGDHGERTALPTTWAAGTIRIDLPADAKYPLRIDPLVTTVGIASNEAFDNRNPDVAFDAESGRWAVVMEERVSAFDTDIKVRRFNSAGVAVDTDYFELAGAVATAPAIAASYGGGNPGTFMAAWIEGGDIISRRMVGTSTGPFASSPLIAIDTQAVDVAGSPIGRFAFTYVSDSAISLPELKTNVITPNGTHMGNATHGSFSGCIRPRISDMKPGVDQWAIAFSDQLSGCLAGDIKFLTIDANGFLQTPITTIAGAIGDDDRNVDIAWSGTHGLMVWDRDSGSHRDIYGQAFAHSGAGYQLLGGIQNLTAMEPGITVSLDQQRPVVATDGARFAVCYLEGSTPRPVCATFAVVSGALVCHEGHVPVITANLAHDNHGIASMGATGGPTTRYLVVADERDGGNDYDVEGAFYDGRQTGAMFTTMATGCTPVGAAEPQLTATGGTDLGNTFALTISGHRGLPFVLVSLPLVTTTLLCTTRGLSQCRLGLVQPFILAQFGAALSVAVPATPALAGVTLAFQGLDLNASGACDASVLGVPFVVTDTVQATLR